MALEPLKVKYHSFYWEIVAAAARQTTAKRHQVGSLIITPSGMLSPGWNGMPSGMTNECESTWVPQDSPLRGMRPKTNPEVIHSERNAIDKMTREGVSTKGAMLLISRAPCFECAKAIQGLGFYQVIYLEDHDDMTGVYLLNNLGIPCCSREHYEN
jgi:dCMP deaminase